MSWKKFAGSPFETYKRDAVASNGMVATNHPLGSVAGLGHYPIYTKIRDIMIFL